MSTQPRHQPVLLRETLERLRPKPGGVYIDATIGLGGHAEAILRASSPDGTLYGVDQDPDAVRYAQKRLLPFGERVQIRQANFENLDQLPEADGVLLDLGISSAQLETSGRGFSFQKNEPLDMRMNPETSTAAADVLNAYPPNDLEQIFRQYGGEKRARQIANAVAKQRRIEPFRTTQQLVETIGYHGAKQRIHPATRVFQALRIAVNRELESLQTGLRHAIQLLKPNGTLCAISFHSLEDRIVKWTYRRAAENDPALRIYDKKPATPTDRETDSNPRARSAKLRALRRLALEKATE